MRCIVLVLSILFDYATAARILGVFPFPAKSHHNVIRPVIIELAERGHEVTFVTPIPVKNPPPNLIQIHIKDYLKELHDQFKIDDFRKLTIPLNVYTMSEAGLYLGEKVYSSKEMQGIIHSKKKYDAIFMESFFIQDCLSCLLHKFDAIGIEISPLGGTSWINEVAGLPDNPAYMIDYKSPYTDKMTYFEKIYNTYVTYVTTILSYLTLIKYQWQMDKYFNYTGYESRPPLQQMVSNKALILINSHLSVGYSYPKAPHVKEIGGVNIVQNNPLPKDLQDFMDGATDGVIYFSFGSNIQASQMISSGKLESLVKVFRKIKQRVIWKWESDEHLPVSKNVKLGKWLPQQDILAHKNIKLFITQGGVLSLFEAVNQGVPLICVPFFADQDKNVKHVETTGYGVKLDFENITETSMTWAINEILTNPSYKTEAQKRSQLFKDRPQSAMDEAIYWIEYVLKHKNILQPQSIHLPFYQLHMLDIFFPLFIIFFFILVVSCKICKWILCSISKKAKKKLDAVDLKKKNNVSKKKKKKTLWSQ